MYLSFKFGLYCANIILDDSGNAWTMETMKRSPVYVWFYADDQPLFKDKYNHAGIDWFIYLMLHGFQIIKHVPLLIAHIKQDLSAATFVSLYIFKAS